MAVYAGRFVVFLACVLFCILNESESKERSKNGCVVCGKKSQGSPFRHVEKNEESVASASSSGTCREMDREMIVLPRHSYLEMEQKLKIISESK